MTPSTQRVRPSPIASAPASPKSPSHCPTLAAKRDPDSARYPAPMIRALHSAGRAPAVFPPAVSGSSFISHVNGFHLYKHAARTTVPSETKIAALNAQLSLCRKTVCTTCSKRCTTLCTHNCSTSARTPSRARTSCATGDDGTRASAAPTPAWPDPAKVARASAVDRKGAVAALTPAQAGGASIPASFLSELNDWPTLLARLRNLRHSYVPSALAVDYRLFLDRVFRRFNLEPGHARKDLALRTLVAGICVTTRDLYSFELGR